MARNRLFPLSPINNREMVAQKNVCLSNQGYAFVHQIITDFRNDPDIVDFSVAIQQKKTPVGDISVGFDGRNRKGIFISGGFETESILWVKASKKNNYTP